MRWLKIHSSALLITLAGWCMYDAILKDDHGWIMAMALIVALNIYHLSEAIYHER